MSLVTWEMVHMQRIFLLLQEFPILCQTCLGDNPYVRMVSDASILSILVYFVKAI